MRHNKAKKTSMAETWRWVYLAVMLASLTIRAQATDRDSLWHLTTGGDQAQRAEAYLALANSYFRIDYDSVIWLAKKAAQNILSEDEMGKAEVWKLIARSKWNLGQYDSAVVYNTRALDSYTMSQDTLEIAISWIRIGGSWLAKTEYDSAASAYFRALELLEEIGDRREIGVVQMELGVLYGRLKDHRKSLKHYQLGLQSALAFQDSMLVINSLNNMGTLFSRQNKIDSSILLYKQALLFIRPGMTRHKAVIYSNLASQYVAKEDFHEALIYFQQSEETFNHSSNKLGVQSLYLSWAKALMDQKKYGEALSMANKALEYAEEFSAAEDVMEAFEMMKNIYSKQRNYRKAFYYFERYDSLGKVIRNRDMQETLEELQLKYNQEKNEKQLADLTIRAQQDKLDAQRIRIRLVGLASALLLLLGGVVLLFLLLKKNRNHTAMLNDKNMAISSALTHNKYLLKEIHHRVKNNLQIISSLLDIQAREISDQVATEALRESSRRVESISRVHQVLYEDSQDTINMAHFVTEMTEHLHYTYSRPDSADSFEIRGGNFQINRQIMIYVGMILNEVLSNAFKHGLPDSEDGRLLITLDKLQELVKVAVCDNGPGFGNEKDHTNDSLGMELIDMFAKKLEATYGWHYDDGTVFSISFVNIRQGDKS